MSKNVSRLYSDITAALTNPVGSQKAYGMMRTHCTALSNVHDKHDVHLLSDHKRECLKLTIQAAAFLVGSIGNGGQATNAEYGMFPKSSIRPMLRIDQGITTSVSRSHALVGLSS
jgi:hypothetical protein